jgi:hypothetical protein
VKTRMYQALILLVGFILTYFNRWRTEYVMLFSGCEFDQPVTLKCNNLMYSSNISSALGYMIVGNCYDNIKNPKNLVFCLLACLSVLSLIEGIFMDVENKFDQRTVFTLY